MGERKIGATSECSIDTGGDRGDVVLPSLETARNITTPLGHVLH